MSYTLRELKQYCLQEKLNIYHTETAADFTLVTKSKYSFRNKEKNQIVDEYISIYREQKKYKLIYIASKLYALEEKNQPIPVQVFKQNSEINTDLLTLWINHKSNNMLWDDNQLKWGEFNSIRDFGYNIRSVGGWIIEGSSNRIIESITFKDGKECFQLKDCDNRIYINKEGFLEFYNKRIGHRVFTDSIVNEYVINELNL